MARQSRFIAPGLAHVVLQRAHGSHALFVSTIDTDEYLRLLQKMSQIFKVGVHAFGLFEHEVRLLVTPTDEIGLSKLIQGIAKRYAQWVQRRHGRAGTPWHGRFASSPIDNDACWLEAMCFVEAVELGTGSLVASSREHHQGRLRFKWVVDHPNYWNLGNTPFEREAAYRSLTSISMSDAMAQSLRSRVQGGWPVGDDVFLVDLERRLGRQTKPAPRGRPRKSVPN